jgi:signal transduction histidine kinase
MEDQQHEISLELIRRSHDLDGLMDLVLDEFERRLTELQDRNIGENQDLDAGIKGDTRLKALMMFAGQAAELKTKAEYNRELQDALDEADESRCRLGGVIEALAAGVVILDVDGLVLGANEAAQKFIGKQIGQIQGKPFEDWIGKIPSNGEGDVIMNAGSGEAQVRLVSRRRLQEAVGGEVILIHDITERERRMEEKNYRDKMDAMLETVGMLTHQINNPLTSILGRAQILRLKGKDNPDVMKAARIVEDSARRISDMISHLSKLAEGGDREELECLIDKGLKAGPIRRSDR